jgi:FkbM family methyltransferase
MTLKQVTINSTTFMVDSEVPSWPEFWSKVEDGSWEPETFALMDRYLTPDWRWVDIGAWIGPTVLYASRKCGRVDAYECDPVALKALRTNLDLNNSKNVAVYNFALGSEDTALNLWSNQFGGSESSLIQQDQSQSAISVSVFDDLKIFKEKGYADDPKIVVKMDVEGAERMILSRLAEIMPNSKCIWYISHHDQNNKQTRIELRLPK